MSVKQPKEFIIDADVLIDYHESDIDVLKLFSTQISQIHIGRDTLQKVSGVSNSEARRLKILVETPTLKLATKASQSRGKLSYDDHVTLLLAYQNNWICITNDNALRSECIKEGVELLWGLEPIKLLVKHRIISLNKSLKIAKTIQISNPDFITDSILSRFEQQIREIVK